MKCKRCGTEGSPGAIFCLNCGMALPEAADDVSSATSGKTIVLATEGKDEEQDADSGRTMVLDSGEKEGAEEPSTGGATVVLSEASSSGATTQFIPREAMAAALAELRAGKKDSGPQPPERSVPLAAASGVEEKTAEEPQPFASEAASPSAVAVTEKPVTVEEPKVEETADEPLQASIPAPSEPVAAPMVSGQAAPPAKPASTGGASFAAIKAKLAEVDADLAALEQRLAQAEEARAAWQSCASGVVLQLKAMSAKDTQARQEMDYEGLAKLINDLVASPRDIELVSALARRAQALKRFVELHRSAVEVIGDTTKAIEPLVDKA